MLGRQKIALDQAGFDQGFELFLRKAGIPMVLIVDTEASAEVEQLFNTPTIIRVPLVHSDLWALANGGNTLFFDPHAPEEFEQIDAPHGAVNAPGIIAAVAELDEARREAEKPETLGPVAADPAVEPATHLDETKGGEPASDQAPAGPGPDAQS